jgi:GrpB-like predicted nucleotidyltransferase (UPF0157 family)
MVSPLDEPITLCNYDPVWLKLFEQEKPIILQALAENILGIEHFGSTSVPGLAAKPIVDILVGLKQYPMQDDAVDCLKRIGYEYLGEAGVPGRLYFRKRQPFAFNIAAVEYNGTLWKDNLLLRDYLRPHSKERQRYEQHKRAVMAAGHHQLLAYSEQKAAIVADLLKQAKAWAKS